MGIRASSSHVSDPSHSNGGRRRFAAAAAAAALKCGGEEQVHIGTGSINTESKKGGGAKEEEQGCKKRGRRLEEKRGKKERVTSLGVMTIFMRSMMSAEQREGGGATSVAFLMGLLYFRGGRMGQFIIIGWVGQFFLYGMQKTGFFRDSKYSELADFWEPRCAWLTSKFKFIFLSQYHGFG